MHQDETRQRQQYIKRHESLSFGAVNDLLYSLSGCAQPGYGTVCVRWPLYSLDLSSSSLAAISLKPDLETHQVFAVERKSRELDEKAYHQLALATLLHTGPEFPTLVKNISLKNANCMLVIF